MTIPDKRVQGSFGGGGRSAALLVVLLTALLGTSGCATYSAKFKNLKP